LAQGDPSKIPVIKWTLTSSQAFQVARYQSRSMLTKERDSLADKVFHARLAGAKKDVFASEIKWIDEQIEKLRLGVGIILKKKISPEETAQKIANLSGIPIVNVKKAEK